MKKYLSLAVSYLIFLTPLFLVGPAVAQAAVLRLIPDTRATGVGSPVTIRVVIDSEETSVNAAQVTIQFPPGILEFTKADKGSVFNFWAQEPEISNDNGTITFIGGTSKGVSGGALEILALKATASGAGTAALSVTDAVVTASDGKGTNVLRLTEGTSIAVGTASLVPTPPPAPAPTPTVEEPRAVTRTPVKAVGLPVKPSVRVPLYSDSSRWYNHTGETIILWEVAEDVTEIAAQLDQNPNTLPKNSEKGLFSGKKFGVLGEGIWYAHVQFRNNIGWGPVAHWRIAIDTTAPLAFEAHVDNEVSDNPTPAISFETADSLSGISHASLVVDTNTAIIATSSPFVLPPQKPGRRHTLMVRVFDRAGNSTEDDLSFEVLPLQTPTVEFLTEKVAQGEVIFMSGHAEPNAFVQIRILNKLGTEIATERVPVDAGGKWEFSLEGTLPTGTYVLSIMTKDVRGAESLPAEAKTFKMKARTIIALGPLDLGWFEIVLFGILIVLSGLGAGTWWYAAKRQMQQAYSTVAARDVDKMAAMLSEDFGAIETRLRDPANSFTAQARAELEALIPKIKEKLEKMKRYLRQEIEDIR